MCEYQGGAATPSVQILWLVQIYLVGQRGRGVPGRLQGQLVHTSNLGDLVQIPEGPVGHVPSFLPGLVHDV